MRAHPAGGSRGARAVALFALAALAAALLGGCTGARKVAGTPKVDARTVIARTPSPAADWTRGGQGLNLGFDPLDLHRHGAVWVGHRDGSARPAFLTTWQTAVTPGQQRNRCAQAAAWLTRIGTQLPGKTIDGSTGVGGRSAGDLVKTCLHVLAEGGPGQGYNDTFGTWPNTARDGYQFGPYLTAFGSGRDRTLAASVLAAPARG